MPGSTDETVLAVVETSSPDAWLHRIEPLPEGCRLQPCPDSPNGFHWYELRVEGAGMATTIALARAALEQLVQASEGGAMTDFRVVQGSSLLAT